jgi:exopolysaccharide biosynthesis protein
VKRLTVLLGFLWCCAPKHDATSPPNEAQGDPPQTKSTMQCVDDWTPLASGVDYRTLCPSLHLLRVDPKRAEIGAVIQPGGRAEGVARAGWTFAQNANFFDQSFQPLGLVISGGKTLHGVHGVSWQSIFAVTRDGKPHIVLPERWPEIAKQTEVALQAGPRLLVDGQPLKVLRADRDWRSGVCIRDSGEIVFFCTPHDAQFDVEEIRDLAAKRDGLACRDAMLFDGGPSVQLFASGNLRTISVEGDKSVPVFVAARSRPLTR